MKHKLAIAAAALAITAFAVQPSQAGPGPGIFGGPWAAPWIIGTVVCHGLTHAQQDAIAARQGRSVTKAERVHGLVGCAFPPLGFLKLLVNDAKLQ